jgi:chromate transport protein ChrA
MNDWFYWLIALVIFIIPDILLLFFGAAVFKKFKNKRKKCK